jgi:hypothetical protein
MKKLLAYVVAMSLAGTASAASIGFGFGTNFYKANAVDSETENGQNFTVSWNLDSDISFGVYTEETNLTDTLGGTLAVSAIQLTKGVMKNVTVGLNLGSGTTDIETMALADIFGAVTILSSSGSKVEGSLVATASARFSQVDIGSGDAADGVNLGLSVLVAF